MRTLFTTLFALTIAVAQVPNPPGTNPDSGTVDPPSRAARLSYIAGTVSFQPGGVDNWVPAEPNRPMTTGDRLWTEEGSRAEMDLGSMAFRLNSRTNFTFVNLDDKTTQAQLSMGTLNIRLRRLAEDETVEIDTPQVAFTLLRPGDYRVEVNEAGDATIVTVRGGDGEGNANGQAIPVHAREQARITAAEGAAPVIDQRPVPPADSFDNFCQDRDRREDLSPSGKYVSRDTPGYSDLDANGTWRTDPQYGAVWVPTTVPADWSPYHYGHWAWIAPWGWTWVDDAPWGYAPFHYGRWAMIGPTWGWIPGPVVAIRPVYSPAMVAWVGGPGLGVGVSVGWFPLGPREVWVPSYRVSAIYMTRVNVTNAVVTEVAIRNAGAGVVYANRGAIIAVRGDAMVGGRPIGAVAVRVPGERVEVIHAAPVVPGRGAILGGRAPLVGSHLPPAAVNRPIVSKIGAPSRQGVRPGPLNHTPAPRPTESRPEARPETREVSAPPRANPPAAQAREERQSEHPAEKKTSKPAKKTSRSEKDR